MPLSIPSSILTMFLLSVFSLSISVCCPLLGPLSFVYAVLLLSVVPSWGRCPMCVLFCFCLLSPPGAVVLCVCCSVCCPLLMPLSFVCAVLLLLLCSLFCFGTILFLFWCYSVLLVNALSSVLPLSFPLSIPFSFFPMLFIFFLCPLHVCVTNWGKTGLGLGERPALETGSTDDGLLGYSITDTIRWWYIMILMINNSSVIDYDINRSQPVTIQCPITWVGAPVDRCRQTGMLCPNRARIIVPLFHIASRPLSAAHQ